MNLIGVNPREDNFRAYRLNRGDSGVGKPILYLFLLHFDGVTFVPKLLEGLPVLDNKFEGRYDLG